MKSYMKQNGMRLAFVALLIVASALGLIEPSMAMMGGAILTVETVAGSTLSVSVTPPSPNTTAAGYSTAIVYTVVGEITELAGVAGRDYNTSEHAPISSRQRQEKKASYKFPPRVFTMGWDQSDAGQDICRTASNDDSVLTWKIVKQGGDIRYFTAQVKGFVENAGQVDNVVQGQMTLLQQTDTVMDPA